jgi:hypothetical protein
MIQKIKRSTVMKEAKLKNAAWKMVSVQQLRIKWHLWRGNIKHALKRLNQLIELASQEKHISRIKKFMTYIINDTERIVDYRLRKQQKLTPLLRW